MTPAFTISSYNPPANPRIACTIEGCEYWTLREYDLIGISKDSTFYEIKKSRDILNRLG
jgi:hypothetical protein